MTLTPEELVQRKASIMRDWSLHITRIGYFTDNLGLFAEDPDEDWAAGYDLCVEEYGWLDIQGAKEAE